MSDSLAVTMLKQKILDMEQHMLRARTAIANTARNGLMALDEDDIDEVRDILKALADET